MLWMDWRLTLVSLITVPRCSPQRCGSASMRGAATTWFAQSWRGQFLLARTFVGRADRANLHRERKSLAEFHNLNDDYRLRQLEDDILLLDLLPARDFNRHRRRRAYHLVRGWRVMQNTRGPKYYPSARSFAFIQYSQRLFRRSAKSRQIQCAAGAMVASYRIFKTSIRR